jgi:hypothetical protein
MNSEQSAIETPKLAELQDAILDAETLERLFRDLELCTKILGVTPRRARNQMVPNVNVTLSDAKVLLASGAISGLQIRYLYEDVEWWDTLIRMQQGVRLVRIRHQFE